METPLVSIITPTFNSAQYISETVQSVQAQSHTNWEHIIIDDCSSDNTRAILKQLAAAEPRIKLIFLEQNGGSGIARNKGIEQAKGMYMTFIDSDDIWFPHFIETNIRTIKEQGCPFTFASYRRSNEELQFVYSDFLVPTKVTYTDILKTNSISCLTAFVDIKALGKEFMPSIRKRQDMGLWLKYLKKTPFAYGIQEPLAIYRIRSASLSRKKSALLRSQWEFYRRVEGLNVFQSLYYMICWAYYGYRKYKD